MRRCQVVDQRSFRASQTHSPGYFALMVRAKFNNCVIVFRRQAQQRHRYTDVVVEIACRIKRVAALA
ncbi:Uncharacterised protein [Shigella sonnei]|nr:Uncharacterised protein [Shigella sonnei]